MSHYCHAIDCMTKVPPKMLFCRPHWALLPRGLKKAVWEVYVPGQEQKKNPTALYLMVQSVAVGYVACRSGVYGDEQFSEHIKRAWDRWHGKPTDEEKPYFRYLMESWG